ncbi:hypothetical protein MKW98_014211 [Papaver atlanticum]|uniref:Uncharacterized protein n=1 Tax=Papaver atlanticum TaxID=357466 RepID=A0AAD4SKP5_9MAGN|nr:hypothetical protein MKW98_014211 [Papaver atlanticum]
MNDFGVATGVAVKEESREPERILMDVQFGKKEYPSESEDDDDEEYPTDEELTKFLSDLESHRYGVSNSMSRNEWPDKDEWIASWKEVPPLSRWTWINVYAHFKKGQGYGGYGVILRNALAKPIIASAKFSKDGILFYQVFMGIKAGVELAEKHERSFLNVQCNSHKVPVLFRDARHCSDNKCRDTRYPNYICKRCESFFSGYRGWNRRLMVPLVVELRGKNIVELTNSGGANAAAHYLAKREKMIKMPEVEKKEETIAPDDDKPAEMEPDDFPQDLKDILWQDAFKTSHFTSVRDEDCIM